MFVDTLSYYSICSRATAEKLNAPIRVLDKLIEVDTFEGKSFLSGEANLTMSFKRDGGTYEFYLRVYTVDRLLPINSELPIILGLSSLQRMGADIRISKREIIFTELENICVPLGNTTSKVIQKYHEVYDKVTFDQDPVEFERLVTDMNDDDLEQLIRSRLQNWIPLEAECKLKGNTPPQHHKGYPVAPKHRENMEEMIEGLLSEGVLIPTTPSADSFVSPAFLRSKGNGGYRLCVDAKPLNSCQVQADLDLPCSMEALKNVDLDTKWFAVVDVSSAFHTVKYKEGPSRRLHTISVFGKHYEYTRCVQGDTNSPRYWMKHLQGLLQCGLGVDYEQWYIPYVDDILIHAKTKEECETRFRYLTKLLLCSGKKISDSQPPSESVVICAMEFTAHGWRMSEDSRVKFMQLMTKAPTNLKELRSALGSVNYMRAGYGWPNPSMSELTENFYSILSKAETTKKENPSVQVHPEEWERLILGFNSRFLSFRKFDESTCYAIMADASDHCCAGAIFALPDGVGGVIDSSVLANATLIDVFSKRFSSAERNWAIFERETYAVVSALTRWSTLLWNSPQQDIVVFTDSMVALRQWTNLKPPERIQSQRRWISWYDEISLYDMEKIHFVHVTGESNTLADTMSRCVLFEEGEPSVTPIEFPKKCFTIRTSENDINERIKHCQLNDDESRRISAVMKADTLSLTDQEKRLLVDFHLMEDVVYYKDADIEHYDGSTGKVVLKPYVPIAMRSELLTAAHNVAHQGWRASYVRLRESYYWPEAAKDMKKFVKQCGICPYIRTEASLKVPDQMVKRQPFEDSLENLFCDHFVGNGIYKDKLCLTVMDGFSGFTLFISVDDETAATAAVALNKWIGVFGLPKHITSDRGPAFDSAIWTSMAGVFGISTHYTSVENPRANMAERPHKLLRALCNMGTLHGLSAADWDTVLALASLSWNTRRSLAVTPSKLMFGKNVTDPFGLSYEAGKSEEADLPLEKRIEDIKAIYRRQKFDSFDENEEERNMIPPIKVGDHVRLHENRNSEVEVGLVTDVGKWSACIEWPSGNRNWRRFGSLRIVNANASTVDTVSEFAVFQDDRGPFLARIIESHVDQFAIEIYDNYMTATYHPLGGRECFWVPRNTLLSYVVLTPTCRLSERSRLRLVKLGVLS